MSVESSSGTELIVSTYTKINGKNNNESENGGEPLSITDITRHPLSCPICRDKYKNPKVLPCLHTFCESCLISYLPPESLTLTCPNCRQQSILPEKGDDGSSSCHQISPISPNNSEIPQKTTPKTNGVHTSNNIAKKVLSTHNNNNNNMVNTNGSKISNGENGAERYLYCPSHAGQTLRFFCRDCDTAVCSSCTDIEHGRHLTIRVNEAVSHEKIRLKELMDLVNHKVDELKEAIGSTEKAICSLSEHKSSAVTEINNIFTNLFKRLDERREVLISDLDNQFISKMDQIQKSKNLLATHLKDVNECCGLTQKALCSENETEILFVKKQIGERLEDYTKMNVSSSSSSSAPILNLDDSLEFDGHALSSLEVSSLGRIVCQFSKNWAVSGEVFESRCVPIARRHFLRLHYLSTSSLAQSYDNIGLGDILVSSSVKECVFSVEQPRESDRRSFIIRFLVSRVGPFSLGVIVRGQHISGSPFQFHGYEADDIRSATQSPVPYLNGSSPSALNSPTGTLSKIPRGTYNGQNGHSNYHAPSLSPRSRMSTPTKKFFSNGFLGSPTGRNGSSSRRSMTLEDDLILKIGSRGRNRGEFTNPQGVAGNGSGRLVVTDSNNQCVQIFDNTGECKLRFGVRGRTVGHLQRPVGVAVLPNNGNIVIADYDNKWISIFDPTGKFMSRFGHGKLLGPKGLTVDSNGHIYVVDNKASCILVFQQNGKLLHKFGSRGTDEGQFAGPHFIAVNSKGNIIVTDFHNHCVKVFDAEGDYLYCFGSNGEGQGQFNAPTGIAVDENDNILVADWGNSRIQIFDNQGSFLSYVSTSVEPLYGPQGLTVTKDGYVAIADSGNHCVKLYKYS